MRLLALIRRHLRDESGRLAVAAGLFTVFTALHLWILARAIAGPGESVAPPVFFAALLALAVATGARHYALLGLVNALEAGHGALETRLLRQLQHCELTAFEALDRDALMDALTGDLRSLPAAGLMLTKCAVLVLRLLAVLVALLVLSPLALAVTLAALQLLGLGLLLSRPAAGAAAPPGAPGGIAELLHGFKEVRLNSARGDALLAAELDEAVQARLAAQVAAGQRLANRYVVAEGASLLLGFLLVLVLPPWLPGLGADLATAGVVVLCLPTMLIRDLPLLAEAEAGLGRLLRLERHLATVASDPPAAPAPVTAFQELRFHEVWFRYSDADGNPGFGVGPLSFSLRAGEVVFVVGDNGSGKSTLLKLLTGLYTPHGGEILLDGKPVALRHYRHLFAAVFADFQLFQRLYGLEARDDEQVNRLLRELDIGDSVLVEHGQFSDLQLSSAERKRVALAVALLEDRTVYILDEWAADQDPVLREHFYRSLLPTLQARSKTIVAVSHDERFFSLADRVLHLDHGRLPETP